MRVLVKVDMEGAAQITDHRECWPVFPEYWRTGRRKLTSDVAAVATGLLAGGATRVLILNGHGTGNWPNVLPELLPDGAEMVPDWQPGTFDATFHVGSHARCGTLNGFVSHTFVPDFRLKIDGSLITENHQDAWFGAVPVLGVVADAALAPQLDNVLAGTPFLTVKHSTTRTSTKPVHADPAASAAAIAGFAERCARGWQARPVPEAPAQPVVACSIDPALIAHVDPAAGFKRTSDSVLTLAAPDWPTGLRAIWAAVGAAVAPLLDRLTGLDLGTDAVLAQDPERLAAARAYLNAWVNDSPPAWRE